MIKFGTSGWRGIIADDFTFDNVKIVTQAIADYVKQNNKNNPKIIVGYDPRFHSENFSKLSSSVLAGNGIKVLLTKRDCPTPVISYEIIRRKTDGGINFTASHNPPEYNGLKFSPSWGGPALPETTKAIEKRCEELLQASSKTEIKEIDFSEGKKKGLIEEIEPENLYIKRLHQLVDLKAIKKSNLKMIIDLLYGTGRGYLDKILEDTGCRVKVLHNYRDVLFGGHPPEPSKENLGELLKILKKEKYNLGLGTDGDADRFGIIDRDGTFITPNDTIALLLNHLVKTRNWKGVVARSVMTTHLVDAVAKKHGIEVRETPVGFKYIGDVMLKEDMIIGGEESGGLTILGHIPEKDGILACLLVAEMVAINKKPIKEILKQIYKEVGVILSTRLNFRMPQEKMEQVKSKLAQNPPSEIASLKVKDINKLDGYKFILEDGSWVGLRLSGTEPVIRIYVEASNNKKINALADASKKFLSD
ncbi:MAG: phosphoglucomutase [Elusimicrobia bacterium RIFOXYC2_FULL_34_12]|nr:MAG: phosphoglucomutase [Elusimicrobia bacterium RIFOXYC2_FULL_34_12]OGS39011.1 MAG: phosphoglucomutase [Elusimicrobia bacterium RIFOXYD2_FULL_34_30]HAM39672.1 phosphoglucomutase [Elusimicrobiota bacterium]